MQDYFADALISFITCLLQFIPSQQDSSSDTWMLNDSSLQHSFIILLLSSAPNFCFVKVRIHLRGGLNAAFPMNYLGIRFVSCRGCWNESRQTEKLLADVLQSDRLCTKLKRLSLRGCDQLPSQMEMLGFCLLKLVFYSPLTPFFKVPPFLFSSQRNADVLKAKLSLSFGDLQVIGFESALLQLPKHNHTLEKCWECPHRLCWSVLITDTWT